MVQADRRNCVFYRVPIKHIGSREIDQRGFLNGSHPGKVTGKRFGGVQGLPETGLLIFAEN